MHSVDGSISWVQFLMIAQIEENMLLSYLLFHTHTHSNKECHWTTTQRTSFTQSTINQLGQEDDHPCPLALPTGGGTERWLTLTLCPAARSCQTGVKNPKVFPLSERQVTPVRQSIVHRYRRPAVHDWLSLATKVSTSDTFSQSRYTSHVRTNSLWLLDVLCHGLLVGKVMPHVPLDKNDKKKHS